MDWTVTTSDKRNTVPAFAFTANRMPRLQCRREGRLSLRSTLPWRRCITEVVDVLDPVVFLAWTSALSMGINAGSDIEDRPSWGMRCKQRAD